MGDLGGILPARGIEHALHGFSRAVADFLGHCAFSLVYERTDELAAALAGVDRFADGRRNDVLALFKLLMTGMSL